MSDCFQDSLEDNFERYSNILVDNLRHYPPDKHNFVRYLNTLVDNLRYYPDSSEEAEHYPDNLEDNSELELMEDNNQHYLEKCFGEVGKDRHKCSF